MNSYMFESGNCYSTIFNHHHWEQKVYIELQCRQYIWKWQKYGRTYSRRTTNKNRSLGNTLKFKGGEETKYRNTVWRCLFNWFKLFTKFVTSSPNLYSYISVNSQNLNAILPYVIKSTLHTNPYFFHPGFLDPVSSAVGNILSFNG